MIGGFGQYARTPLNPLIEHLESPAAFTAERITLQAMPGVEATGVLLIPTAGAGRKQKSCWGTQNMFLRQTNGNRKCPSHIIEMPNLESRETVEASKELLGAIQRRGLTP